MTNRVLAATMVAVIVRRFGGPEVLEPGDLPTPSPGPGEVLVRLHAIGVNFADTERRRGIYAVPDLPWTPGREGAGEVVAAGPGVDGALVGARVSFWSPRAGSAYAQYALAPADELFVLDATTPFEVAAALPLQGLTAWGVVREAAAVAAGETVLIHAAAGGVGQLAAQLARAAGARVLGTASTDEKRARLEALGVEPLAYGDDLAARVRAATAGRGVDVVLDSVGRDTQAASLASLAPFGRLVFYGEASGPATPVAVEALYAGSLRVGAFDAHHLVADPARSARARAALLDALLSGRLRVEIGARLPLAEARRAHELLETRRTTGKVILAPPAGLPHGAARARHGGSGPLRGRARRGEKPHAVDPPRLHFDARGQVPRKGLPQPFLAGGGCPARVCPSRFWQGGVPCRGPPQPFLAGGVPWKACAQPPEAPPLPRKTKEASSAAVGLPGTGGEGPAGPPLPHEPCAWVQSLTQRQSLGGPSHFVISGALITPSAHLTRQGVARPHSRVVSRQESSAFSQRTTQAPEPHSTFVPLQACLPLHVTRQSPSGGHRSVAFSQPSSPEHRNVHDWPLPLHVSVLPSHAFSPAQVSPSSNVVGSAQASRPPAPPPLCPSAPASPASPAALVPSVPAAPAPLAPSLVSRTCVGSRPKTRLHAPPRVAATKNRAGGGVRRGIARRAWNRKAAPSKRFSMRSPWRTCRRLDDAFGRS